MISTTRILNNALLPVLLVTTLCGVSGCSSNDTIKEDPALAAKRLDAAGKQRALFDKAKGKYESLSPEDKKAMDDLSGGEAKSREAFGHMVYSAPGGAAAGGGLPASGPGSH